MPTKLTVENPAFSDRNTHHQDANSCADLLTNAVNGTPSNKKRLSSTLTPGVLYEASLAASDKRGIPS